MLLRQKARGRAYQMEVAVWAQPRGLGGHAAASNARERRPDCQAASTRRECENSPLNAWFQTSQCEGKFPFGPSVHYMIYHLGGLNFSEPLLPRLWHGTKNPKLKRLLWGLGDYWQKCLALHLASRKPPGNGIDHLYSHHHNAANSPKGPVSYKGILFITHHDHYRMPSGIRRNIRMVASAPIRTKQTG